MPKFIIRTLIVALAVIGASYLLVDIIVTDFVAALLFALVLGVLNALLRPLVKLITLPIRWLTFGLSTLLINMAMFWLAARFVPGVTIASLLAVLWGALLVGAVSWLTNQVFKKKKK